MDVGFDAKELEISFNGKMLSSWSGNSPSAKMGNEAGEDEDEEEKAPAKSESPLLSSSWMPPHRF